MSKVYVSSTFRDLRTCRDGVAEAVRLLGHQDVAMEHYGAEPRPPLKKALRDVEACDVYVGIFGRSYGWVPPGSTQSITEQEYRQARRAGKEILVFLLDKDAEDWTEPEAELAVRKVQLATLREELSIDFLAVRFVSCAELTIKVIAGLANLGAPRVTPADVKREDDLLQRVLTADPATVSQSVQALVDMGSAAYAALLHARLWQGNRSQESATADVGRLATIEQQNHRVMPILRDLLGVDDPATQVAVVSKIAQGALAGQRVADEDVRAILALSSDESADIRREVGHDMWTFLPRDGAIGKELLKKLTILARFDSDKTVREAAQYSLDKMSGG